MTLPGQQARQNIDSLLEAADWTLQDRSVFVRNASCGIAVREFSLSNGPCDYLLFIDGKAAGVIEAKKEGVTLSAVADQSARYMANLPVHLASWDKQLRYEYESTGEETFFCDQLDPKPRSRRLFAFHQPQTLRDWLTQSDTLSERLQYPAKAKKVAAL